MTVSELGTKFGLGFSLGVLQAIAIALVIIWTASMLVEFIWTKRKLQKHTIKKLPEHVKRMELYYHRGANLIVATTTVVIGDKKETRFKATTKPNKEAVEVIAINLQLNLLREIAEELGNGNRISSFQA